MIFLYHKRLKPPPTRSLAFLIFPYLANPRALLGSGSACFFGCSEPSLSHSEPSLTARIRQAPDNAYISAPGSV